MVEARERINDTMDSTADRQLHRFTAPEVPSASNDKAVVVGLYGLPGSGETYLLNQLKRELGHSALTFYEGSEMAASVFPGGLNVFQHLPEQGKEIWRPCAINAVGNLCADSGKVAVVTGNFMFWPE